MTQHEPLKNRLIPLALAAVFLLCAPSFAGTLTWDPGMHHLGLRLDGETVWRFNYGDDTAKPYFHPVAVPGAGTLTWKSPEDHPWHHALWFSWKFINGVNYWEESRDTGQSAGITAWRGVTVTTKPDFSAKIVMVLEYHLPGEAPLLTEHRTVSISAPNPQRGYAMDWTCAFTAGDKEVLLDRTPLPHEPNGKSYGGYAGLSVRFAEEFKDWRIADSEGQIKEPAERIRVPARAVDYSGTLNGKEAGIAIIDHPENLNAPSPWYIIVSPNGPMRYFSPAVIQQQPHKMAPHDSFTLRYRVIVHPGKLNPAALLAEHKAFARK